MRVLDQLCPSGRPRVLASGRTDAGVHALGQVIRIDLDKQMEPDALRKGINALIDKDIHLSELNLCDPEFHPILNAKNKEYRYYFAIKRELTPAEMRSVVRLPYDLDEELMRSVCQSFVGEHDFQNYFCLGTPVKSTVRTIYECELIKLSPSTALERLTYGGEVFMFRVVGSGFLKQMVRLMVAMMWSVGRGHQPWESFESSLKGPLPHHLAPVAPPQGLFLHRVEY